MRDRDPRAPVRRPELVPPGTLPEEDLVPGAGAVPRPAVPLLDPEDITRPGHGGVVVDDKDADKDADKDDEEELADTVDDHAPIRRT